MLPEASTLAKSVDKRDGPEMAVIVSPLMLML
jgi:hypothetical protein